MLVCRKLAVKDICEAMTTSVAGLKAKMAADNTGATLSIAEALIYRVSVAYGLSGAKRA